jgi:TolB-like protein/DNA-binding winged helix-turn-helix (wHTH) protein/Flp pilus assembly protein TadD
MLYRFAGCELDPSRYHLYREGERIEIEPKAFDVLVYLVRHRDRMVSKDELLDKLWPGQVVGEAVLTRCIGVVRKAVGDDRTKQAVIATQHGRGYRFVATVAEQTEAVLPSSSSDGTGSISVTINGQSSKPVTILPSLLEGQDANVDAAALKPVPVDVTLPPSSTPVRTREGWGEDQFYRKSLARWGAAVLALVAGVTVMIRYVVRPSHSPQSSALVTPAAPQALPLPDKPSIIVLPFTNLSGDPGQEYFSDGLTDDLITDLSRIPQLFVIARQSAFTYKGRQTKVQDISREMGVRYVLEGSVQRAEQQLRILAQLSDATTGEQLWAERYDRELKDIFTVQDDIRQKIATTLKLQLLIMKQGFQGIQTRKTTDNLEAYDCYLRGMEPLLRAGIERNKEANIQARQLFEKALALDPQYAMAYVGLGVSYFYDGMYLWSPNRVQLFERALELTQRAIALDGSSSVPHLLLSRVYGWKKQHEQAVAEARQGIALDPNDAEGYRFLGEALIFAGRSEEAIEAMEKAMRLNPRHPFVYLFDLARAYRWTGRYAEAVTLLKKVVTLAPNHFATLYNLAICYVELGREAEAQAEVAEMLRIDPDFSLERAKQEMPLKDPAAVERNLAGLRKAGLK